MFFEDNILPIGYLYWTFSQSEDPNILFSSKNKVWEKINEIQVITNKESHKEEIVYLWQKKR